MVDTVDGPAKSESPVENDGKHPIIYRVSTIHLVGVRRKNQWIGVRKTHGFLPSNIGGSGSDFPSIQFYDKWLICFLIRNLEDVEALLILEDR